MKFQYSAAELAVYRLEEPASYMPVSISENVEHGIEFFERNDLDWVGVKLDVLDLSDCRYCMAGQLLNNFSVLIHDVRMDLDGTIDLEDETPVYNLANYLGLLVNRRIESEELQGEWVERITVAREAASREKEVVHAFSV